MISFIAAGSKIPLLRIWDSDKVSWTRKLRSFRNHEPTGAPKPRFFRFRMEGGSQGLTTFLSKYFIVRPRTFKSEGIRLVSSINSESIKGARHSIEAAIVILSVKSNRSSGREDFIST